MELGLSGVTAEFRVPPADLTLEPTPRFSFPAVVWVGKIALQSGEPRIFREPSIDRSGEFETKLSLRPISGETERELMHLVG